MRSRMESGAYRLRDVWSVPGCLSLSRVGVAIVFPFAIDHRAWALTLFLYAALSDYFDGYLARRYFGITPIGAALDPITDKIFAISVMVTLITVGRLSIGQALLLSLRELIEVPLSLFLASVPHARVARGARLGSNASGKLTTALQFGALLAVLIEMPGREVVIVATAVVGAFSGGTYVRRFIAAWRAPTSRATVPTPP